MWSSSGTKEGSVERLNGPPLMNVEHRTSSRFDLDHPFNTGLGIPIARQSDDAQGTVTLLFREVKTSNGEPSDRILALTNKHVASLDTSTHYEFDGTNPQHILVCGEHRLARAVVEIDNAINTGLRDALRLGRQLEDLQSKAGGANSTALRRTKSALEEKKEDNATLQTLSAEVNADWKDTNSRKFGVVD